MRPRELYDHPAIHATFQAGIDGGYVAGRSNPAKKLGGLLKGNEVRVDLPQGEGTYYDFWCFPGSAGFGYDRAWTPFGQITRPYIGMTRAVGEIEKLTLELHRESLQVAGTRTRLDKPYVRPIGHDWIYSYGLLLPPIGSSGFAIGIEEMKYKGTTTFIHLFGLIPQLSNKVPAYGAHVSLMTL